MKLKLTPYEKAFIEKYSIFQMDDMVFDCLVRGNHMFYMKKTEGNSIGVWVVLADQNSNDPNGEVGQSSDIRDAYIRGLIEMIG